VRFIQEKRLRALGVTGAKRAASMPQLPTVAEAGIRDFTFETWYGLFAPAGVRPEIVARLNGSINTILSSPDVKQQFARQGLEPAGGSAEAFDAYFKAEVARLAKAVRPRGIGPQ
jgi:tripartite-type tricarboxylate transporter receptor subunit TctC